MGYNISLCDNGLFRGIFGQIGSEGILAELLNSVLRNAGDKPIETLKIRNPFQLPELALEKEPVLDIKSQDSSRRWFDVEIQLANHEHFRERILYYWARLYGHRLRRGDNYRRLTPAVGVVFTKFPILPDEPQRLCSSVYLAFRHNPSREYSDHLRLHFVYVPNNLDKIEELEIPADLKDWLLALNYPRFDQSEQLVAIERRNPVIKDVLERAREFMSQPSVREYMEAKYKYEHDQASILDSARRAARAKGRAEGLLGGQVFSIAYILQSRFNISLEEAQSLLVSKTEEELRSLLLDAATASSLDEILKKL